MKENLMDVTFLILIRLDSLERLENILYVTNTLTRYFNTNVKLLEAADHNNRILKSLISSKIDYRFIEDKDPVLHKTKHFNQMINETETPFISIWDADTVVDKRAVLDAVNRLRSGDADMAFPYDGFIYNTSEIIKNRFLEKRNIQFLRRNKGKMELLYDQLLVGAAVLMNKSSFIYAGMENELHYGWGNDDFDRYHRFVNLGLKIYRVNTALFHLSHPRGVNSAFRSTISTNISKSVLYNVENSSCEELRAKFVHK